jgi:hypothetical protein
MALGSIVIDLEGGSRLSAVAAAGANLASD